MKVGIFGATGNLGKQIVNKLLSTHYEVLAFVRNPERMKIINNLEIVSGDIYDYDSVYSSIENCDSVVVALGAGKSLGKTDIRSTGTANVIKAMKDQNVNRLVVVSAMGVGESWKDLSAINRFFFMTLLKNSRTDHEAQEQMVTKSELDWTLIRPSGLTDEPGTGIYDYGAGIRSKTSRIPRADVAHLILQILEDSSSYCKAITITN